jgi:hypothetical protein
MMSFTAETTWSRFALAISNTMDIATSRLNLAYKLSTETKSAFARDLKG